MLRIGFRRERIAGYILAYSRQVLSIMNNALVVIALPDRTLTG